MQLKKIISLIAVNFMLITLCLFNTSAEAFSYETRIATSKSLAHYTIGYIYDLLGESERAILEYDKALHYDKAAYVIHLRLGTDYARLNMLNEAIDELKLVSKFNSEDLQSRYLLALIYSTLQQYDNAAMEYEYILQTFSQSEPENIEIYGYLGQLYYSQRKYDKAISQFEKILELESENTDVMYLLGSLYLEVDNKQSAIEVLTRVIETNPEHDGSLNTLGYIYAEEGENLSEAKSLIERALKVSPENGAYMDSLGWVYYQQGDYRKAIEVFQQANEIMRDPVIFEHLGDAYKKLGEYDRAVEAWESSLELLPEQKGVMKKIDEVKSSQVSI